MTENIVVGVAGAAAGPARPQTSTTSSQLLDLSDVANGPSASCPRDSASSSRSPGRWSANPDVLLLDEPAGGLDTRESQWLGERLRRIRDSGVTILLVDHDMHLVLNLCDAIYVLDFGRIIAQGPPAAVKRDRRVAEAYLGQPTPSTVAP